MAVFHQSPSESTPTVRFFFQDVQVKLTNRKLLKGFIISLLRKEKKTPGSINYIFCTDKALLAINREYLKHDFFTDIITFDLSETGTIQGEIYISIERVKENSRLLDTTFKEELHRVIFHG